MKPYRTIDWCALVTYLEQVATPAEIAKQTGLTVKTLCDIKCETVGGSNYDRVINLMLMFLDKTDKNIPIYGEHHEGVD